MSDAPPDVLLLDRRIETGELRRLVERYEDMVKYVVDVERGVVAIGGEMHVDDEQVLLESGSRQADLWGANYYPGRDATAASSSRPSSTSGPRRGTARWSSRIPGCATGCAS